MSSQFFNNAERKTAGNFLQPNNLSSKGVMPLGTKNFKGQSINSNNPFIITPTTFESRNFYSRVNTSPAKEKLLRKESDDYEESKNDGDKTIRKVNFTNPFQGEDNFFSSSNFLTENISVPKQVKFSANSGVKAQVRFLSSGSDIPFIKKVDSKPSLNLTESRNKMIAFSKGKKFEEDLVHDSNKENKTPKTSDNSTLQIQQVEPESDKVEEIVEESHEEEEPQEPQNQSNIDPRMARLLELQKSLPVPIDRKDDEKFKILKMKEMRKISLPANRSAKSDDLLQTPTHQKSFMTGSF
jgi:hypothetical protein